MRASAASSTGRRGFVELHQSSFKEPVHLSDLDRLLAAEPLCGIRDDLLKRVPSRPGQLQTFH